MKNREITEYILIEPKGVLCNTDRFVEEINKKIKEGYQPFGNHTVNENGVLQYQAMVKYKDLLPTNTNG